MSWNDDVKKILDLIPQIENIQKAIKDINDNSCTYDDKKLLSELESIKNSIPTQYNDTEINKSIASLHESIKIISDSILELKRNESSARTNQELAQNFEHELGSVKLSINKLKAYDDTDLVKRITALENAKPPSYNDEWIKREIKLIKSKLVKPYSDKPIRDEIKQISNSMPKQYNDEEIKKQIKEIKSSIPPKYDDTEIKSEVSQLLKYCEAQTVTITALSKECGKINQLENLIKSKDDNIKSLKLDLKRAESAARTCEELMISMEQKVNDLSKRLTNGN